MEKKTMDLGFLEFILFGASVIGIYLVSKNLILSAITLVALALFFAFDGFTRELKRLVSVILLIILAFLLFFTREPKLEYKPLPDNQIVNKDIEEKDEEEKSDEQDNPQLESNSNKIATGDIYERNPQRGSKTSTYGGITATNGEIPEIGLGTNLNGPTSFGVTLSDADEYNKQLSKEVEDLKDQGYNVEPLPKGAILATKPVDDTNPKEEEKNYDDVKEFTDEELEKKLESFKPSQTVTTEDKQNEPSSDVNSNQNSSSNVVQEENKQQEEVKQPEETTKPDEQPKQDVEQQKGEEPSVQPTAPEKPSVEEQKTLTPVSISPIDGDTAYAGDAVQFKVDGDIKSVEGLDGLKYSLSGGYLTVYTNASEATVLSPTLVGEDGSTASSSVTISVLNA